MIVLIDNYDSFVYNLARYFIELGQTVEVIRNDALTVEDIDPTVVSHLVLSPGPCSPNEAGICLALIERWLPILPILGVCLGHQAIGQAVGGRIVRAKQPMHGKPDRIQHDGQDLFQGLPTQLTVGRYHSLVIEPDSIPNTLQVTAWSQQKEIMAVKHRDYPCYGVQFHPESILTCYGHALLKNFLRNFSPSASIQ